MWIFVILVSVFLIGNRAVLYRNDKVYECRMKALDQISILCLMDSVLGLQSSWRFKVFDEISYKTQLWSFKSPESYFEGRPEFKRLNTAEICDAIMAQVEKNKEEQASDES